MTLNTDQPQFSAGERAVRLADLYLRELVQLKPTCTPEQFASLETRLKQACLDANMNKRQLLITTAHDLCKRSEAFWDALEALGRRVRVQERCGTVLEG